MIGISIYTACVIAGGLIALWHASAGLKRRNTYFFGWRFDRAQKAFPYWLSTSVMALIAIWLLLYGLVLAYAISLGFMG